MKTNNTNVSLELAHRLSETVSAAWESGEMMELVTPATQELLKFWFSEEYCSLRNRNFHAGQRQAILNIVYLHEVMGVKNVLARVVLGRDAQDHLRAPGLSFEQGRL